MGYDVAFVKLLWPLVPVAYQFLTPAEMSSVDGYKDSAVVQLQPVRVNKYAYYWMGDLNHTSSNKMFTFFYFSVVSTNFDRFL